MTLRQNLRRVQYNETINEYEHTQYSLSLQFFSESGTSLSFESCSFMLDISISGGFLFGLDISCTTCNLRQRTPIIFN